MHKAGARNPLPLASGAGRWRDPPLGGGQAVGMLTKDLFDCICEPLDGGSRAGPSRREQDQSGVRLPACQALRSDGPEVLHVVRDHGSLFGGGDLEDQSVAPSG